ncbi:retrotransposon protein, putative, ty1-copia subclass, partial [Tanacetum coccineum]
MYLDSKIEKDIDNANKNELLAVVKYIDEIHAHYLQNKMCQVTRHTKKVLIMFQLLRGLFLFGSGDVEMSFSATELGVHSRLFHSITKDNLKKHLTSGTDHDATSSGINGGFCIWIKRVDGSCVCRVNYGARLRANLMEKTLNSKSHMVLGIAPVAIIDRQLPFEYTITSRSTDVVVMAQPVQNINHSAFRSMFKREKLSGNNFNDWFRQLKLVLRVEKKMYVIEQPLPAAPAADSEAQAVSQWNAVYDAYNELKAMFEKQAGVERFDLIQTFHACKQEEGKPVAAYVIQMKGYVDQLERLGYMLPQDLIVGLILNGLTKDFAGFVRNYNMHNIGKTIGELHAMLIEYEKGLPKKAETPQVMMIKGGKIQKAKKKSLKAKGKGKANGKGNDKQVYIPKPKNPKPSAKEHLVNDDTYHHCKEVGHWKRNCSVYLAELLKKKKQVGSASSSGIFTIELFAFPNKSWVYDTSCGTHICITKHGFREARKLKQGALYLYVGNGVRAQVEAIRSYDLVLPNGLVICLDNCHYAPSITRGVVSVHRLVENGFVYTKRAKHNLDSTYLWHCRLAHISKKRIEKLQQEGLLKSTDDESLIPMRYLHVSRQGASYFITFTDDYSRYGYVYLLKHKHEVFETFKVFKNEVENQLGKTIKALRSDRGGEYISQEFKDYLKACGIVQQLTPPYTPQHNGVSERRNRTLLDMVRSMMNLTTLPLSFWDYALESATRILNMVPTKKVWRCEELVKWDTPYKLQQRFVKCIFIGYPKETMGYYFYFPPENKIVVARYAEFFEKNLITQEVSGRAMDLEEIQDVDTSPSEITSEIPMEVEGFEPPQEEVILVRRSERTHQAPDRLCLNVEAEEHSLGDLNEPTSYKAVMLDSESNKWIDAMNAEIQSMMDNMIILIGIDNDIYSTVDACPNACEMWKAIERLKQVNVQFLLQLQPEWQRNRGQTIVTSSAPTYDPEPATVTKDEEMSKEKEIDKLMALILPRSDKKKIYKPTNNNLRTSSNTSRANQDNSLRINIGTGHVSRESQKLKRVKDAAYHKEKMLLCKQEEAEVQLNAEQADWKDDTDDESDDQELEAHYMYMAQIQEVTPDPVDNSGPIFDDEPMHKVQNDNDNYNVFAMENEHPEQPESSNDIYLAEHGDTNITIDSLDICYDRVQDDQDDTDDLDQERDLLASLIQKLKCEIDDSKNQNKFLESSNKALVDKLKGEI